MNKLLVLLLSCLLCLLCCTASYCIATPTFDPDGGSFTSSVTVTISCSTPGSSIRYTTDGTDPNPMSGTLYTGPVTLDSSKTLKAVGYIMGQGMSSIKSAAYTIVVATPTFSPDGGTYTDTQTVTIACTTSGATIKYTTDGSTPTSGSTTYSSPLTIDVTTTLKAIGIKTGLTNSAVKSGTYTINRTVATPTMSPAGGTYSAAQSVTISCSTSGATIRYTTDGSTPTSGSTQYTSAIAVNDDTTIKSKAFKTDWTDSAVATEVYVINYVRFVNVSATGGTYNGQSWATAYQTIGAAITAANDGDELWVASGTYNERITTKSGLAIYGGFAGTESARDSRDYRTNVVTLNGGSAGVVVTIPQSATTATIIDGFKIQGGGSSSTGGGILINQDAEAVIRNCYITLNAATSGAGIYSHEGMPTITNNMILSNTATNGSAIYLEDSPAIITNNTIVINTASANGAIYINSGSAPTIANNIIQGNSSGIYNSSGTPTVRNNCVYGNTGYNYSGLSAGTNDISQNPTFIDSANGNYHLDIGSPCINAGNDADMHTTKDWDMQDRKNGSAVDMGVDETYTVANPVINPNGGTFNAPKPVDLTCSTTGASIHYTTNGSDPTIASAEYTGSLSLDSSCTLKVRTFKTYYLPSDISSAAFTIIDTAPPVPGILNAPEYVDDTDPFTLTYTGAYDIGDNGLEKVELWYKYGVFGTWTNTTQTRTTGSGSFNFTPASGVGVYYFMLVAEDNGSLRSDAASGEGQDSTIYIYNLDACSVAAIVIPAMP